MPSQCPKFLILDLLHFINRECHCQMECLQETEATCWIRLALVQILFPTPPTLPCPAPNSPPMHTPDLHLPHPGHNPRYIRKAKFGKHYTLFVSELKTLMYVGGREYFFCMFVGLQCLVLTYFGLNNTPGPGPWHPNPPMTASTQIRRWHYCFLDHSYKWRSFGRSASLKIPNVFSKVCRRQCCQ